ncbi:hypothetical protein RJ639_011151 [Escallonia herrerae]|uniref:BHLH domain-containing protein n=1 Tax=Escallonia herrerae TaxID=1293975 RepID=A0AA88VKZ2_9ASTE|nr:hypothetical protein RJ639_011151 [Escallonia herrerae]
MSSRRTRASKIVTEDELNDLVLKLQVLVPNSGSSCTTRVPALKIIKETCKYIKRLQGEVEDISERLSQLLASMDNSGVDTDFLRRLLQQ